LPALEILLYVGHRFRGSQPHKKNGLPALEILLYVSHRFRGSQPHKKVVCLRWRFCCMLAIDFVARSRTKKWFAQQVEFSWMLFHENSTKKTSYLPKMHYQLFIIISNK